MKIRRLHQSKKFKDGVIKLFAIEHNLSTGAQRLARALINYKAGQNINFKEIEADLGISRVQMYKDFKELQSKGLVDYERKPKKPK